MVTQFPHDTIANVTMQNNVTIGDKMKTNHRSFHRMYGTNEYGFSDIPEKISNIQIQRYVVAGNDPSVCSRCFPHGWETPNSHYSNTQKSWKEHRKSQYRPISA